MTTTLLQAQTELLHSLNDKIQYARQVFIDAPTGVHIGNIRIVDVKGYGENTTPELNMYTPSSYLQIELDIHLNGQRQIAYDNLKINGQKIHLDYGCISKAAVVRALKKNM